MKVAAKYLERLICLSHATKINQVCPEPLYVEIITVFHMRV